MELIPFDGVVCDQRVLGRCATVFAFLGAGGVAFRVGGEVFVVRAWLGVLGGFFGSLSELVQVIAYHMMSCGGVDQFDAC